MISNLLADYIELWGFESDVMIYKDFSIGKILKLKPIDISCSTGETLQIIKKSISQALNSLPEGARVQFFQEITPNAQSLLEKYRSSINSQTSPLVSELAQEKITVLSKEGLSGNLVEASLYLIVRLDFENKPKPKKWYQFLFKKDDYE